MRCVALCADQKKNRSPCEVVGVDHWDSLVASVGAELVGVVGLIKMDKFKVSYGSTSRGSRGGAKSSIALVVAGL